MKRFKNILCVVEPREKCKPPLNRQIDCSVLAIKPPGFVTPVTLEE